MIPFASFIEQIGRGYGKGLRVQSVETVTLPDGGVIVTAIGEGDVVVGQINIEAGTPFTLREIKLMFGLSALFAEVYLKDITRLEEKFEGAQKKFGLFTGSA